MGHSEALLRRCWGTHWELESHVGKPIENLMGTHWKPKNPTTPTPKKEKEKTELSACWLTSLAVRNVYVLPLFFIIFGIG
jgi:hypothetical protein